MCGLGNIIICNFSYKRKRKNQPYFQKGQKKKVKLKKKLLFVFFKKRNVAYVISILGACNH